MEQLKIYLDNLSWIDLIDLVALGVFTLAYMAFFARKKNLKVGLLVFTYMLFAIGVDLIIAFTGYKYFYFVKELTNWITIILIVSICVVYQSDLKMLFAKFGNTMEENVYAKLHSSSSEDDLRYATGEIVKACQNMAKNDIGALIVVCPTIISTNVLDTGIRLNCILSAPILESVFNTHAPLHDGAVIVKNNMILAAGCFLPLSQNPSISKDLGTRHRAAIGITEESDVLTIVVSEETGIISIVQNGDIKRYMTSEKLMDALDEAFGINDISRRRSRNFGRGGKR